MVKIKGFLREDLPLIIQLNETKRSLLQGPRYSLILNICWSAFLYFELLGKSHWYSWVVICNSHPCKGSAETGNVLLLALEPATRSWCLSGRAFWAPADIACASRTIPPFYALAVPDPLAEPLAPIIHPDTLPNAQSQPAASSLKTSPRLQKGGKK